MSKSKNKITLSLRVFYSTCRKAGGIKCIEKPPFTMKFYYVYILKCSDKTYYTGFTSNLEQRFMEHQSGKYSESYTHSRRPVLLEFYQGFIDPNQAIMFEKKIKKWSQAKKEALINGEFEKLPNLAKKKFK